MADQQSSELLRVLGQLDDGAWAETLLPLLRANKSAGAAALACEQLRRLCQDNQRELQLAGANCQRLGPLELDVFSWPFPACSSVVFTASSTDDVAYTLTSVVPLLARLPKLQSLQLNFRSSTARQPARMAPALQLLRLQLPQLRSLQLELAGSWTSDSQQAWALLGAATQLTKLMVGFKNDQAYKDDGDPGLSLQHLSALQPLGSGLQQLELTASVVIITTSQDCSFLSTFSGLTSLELPLISKRSGLAAISSCTALQEMQFVEYGEPVLDAAECAALAQLTQLTWLDIPRSADVPDILSALRCLSGLQSLLLEGLSSSHLPVLAALTKLTSLRGLWVDGPTDQATPTAAGALQHACPSVVEVCVKGPLPLSAFPGSKQLTMCDTWQPSRLASLGQHMKKLELLGISSNEPRTFRSLDRSVPEAERVAAVHSLGQLAQLTELQFALNDDAEAAALATTCTQLKELCLFVPRGSSVTALGLSSCLGRLNKLHVLDAFLHGLQLSQAEAMLLLSFLSGVQEVFVATKRLSNRRCGRRQRQRCVQAGCPCL